MKSKSKDKPLRIGERVKYFRHQALIGEGIITLTDYDENGKVYDVTLDSGVKYWGYADQFQRK